MSRLSNLEQYRYGELVEVYSYVTDSGSQPQLFHDCDIWFQYGEWWAECDRDVLEGAKFYCKANRLGSRLCSHLARCLVEFNKDKPILGKEKADE